MLEEQDFKKIGEVIKENTDVNNEKLLKEVSVMNEKLLKEVSVMFEDNNIKLSQVMEEKIEVNNKRIGEELGKVIEQNITPVLDSLDKRLTKVESNMVTKDDLSRGLANLKGDINIKLREEDKKVNILIKHHIEKNLLKDKDIQSLRQIEVFPQL